jgi:hypothetical protein
MTNLVFMVEEPSMKEALNGLLPKILPSDIPYIIITHDGKSDLDRSLSIKLKGWGVPDTTFIVLRDCDGGDCYLIKDRLLAVCKANGRPETLIRIVCQELESWFLGDLGAVSRAMNAPHILKQRGKAKLRDPDNIPKPSNTLKAMLPGYQKISGARRIARELGLYGNRSVSFQVFLAGIQRITGHGPQLL